MRGTAKPSAWSALQDHVVAPKVTANADSQWQTLMDDTWSEFMVGIKARQRTKAEASMFRVKKALYTEQEVTEWLLDAEMEAKRAGYFGAKPPSKRVIKRIIDSVCENKVQQFGAQDSDEEEEQEEMDEIIEAARDVKAAAVGKLQRYVRREIGWQTQTLAWQKAVTEATIKMEEELVMTYQVMTNLAKRGGPTGGIADPAMRERMWATMQAKQALRAAMQNTPEAMDDAELDDDVDDEMESGDESDKLPRSAPSTSGSLRLSETSKRGPLGASLKDRWKSSDKVLPGAGISGGSSSGSGVPSGSVSGTNTTDAKKSSHHKHAVDPNARTTTTSSMRRHRAGKKAKEAKAAKLAAFDE
jgi:hypothetical protein